MKLIGSIISGVVMMAVGYIICYLNLLPTIVDFIAGLFKGVGA